MDVRGISRIDALLGGDASCRPLVPDDSDAEAVGAVQDFLACHGYKGMPGPLAGARGRFGPQTTNCVQQFQRVCGLAPTGHVDRATLQMLIEREAQEAIASHAYLQLVLRIPYEGLARVMSLTCLFEGAGRFAAINRNTDRAGLSYGLIQWAQKPGRLHELLQGFSRQEPAAYVRIFGDGDAALANRLLAHTAKPRGGTDARGVSVDPQFELTDEPWLARFRRAACERALQRVQVSMATAAFATSLAQIRKFAPQLSSERAIAFMLDLANQHGDAGARSIFRAAQPATHRDEASLLLAVEHESVRRVAEQFGAASREVVSTRARRTAFRSSSLLSDNPFEH